MADTNARMLQLIGTTADWAASPLTLDAGEIGFEILTDGTVKGKVGDGVTPFASLPFSMGEGVTLTTEQTITGFKTIDNELQFLNQSDGVSRSRIIMIDFPDPLLSVAALEPGSNMVIAGTKDDGTFQNLILRAQDEKLFFGTKLIADYGGVAGDTWGLVNGDGSIANGIRFDSVKNAVGHYTLAFDDAAFNNEQSCVASPVTSGGIGFYVNVKLETSTQVDVFIFDSSGIATDLPFSFVRKFANEEYTEAPTSSSQGV